MNVAFQPEEYVVRVDVPRQHPDEPGKLHLYSDVLISALDDHWKGFPGARAEHRLHRWPTIDRHAANAGDDVPRDDSRGVHHRPLDDAAHDRGAAWNGYAVHGTRPCQDRPSRNNDRGWTADHI